MAEWKAMGMLRQAHETATERLKTLEAAGELLAAGRDDEALPALREQLAFFNGELQEHFLHEEEALFPELGRVIGDMGPVGAMREEHRTLWLVVDDLSDAVERMERGDRCRLETGRIMAHILWLLRGHIEREDKMLFPLAESYLDERARQLVDLKIEARSAGVK